jgi:hypothetical protein
MKTVRNAVFAAVAAFAATGCLADEADLDPEDLGVTESEVVVDGPLPGRGTGGRPFHTSNWNPDDKIVGVQVRSGSEIDGLIVHYQSGRREVFGGSGGTLNQTFQIFDGEVLVGFTGRAGARIDSLRFVTSTGRVSQHYGGHSGERAIQQTVPSNGRILGFHGRAQNRIDNIGLVWDVPAR